MTFEGIREDSDQETGGRRVVETTYLDRRLNPRTRERTLHAPSIPRTIDNVFRRWGILLKCIDLVADFERNYVSEKA